MSFFDQASLVMIPSGYKTSKVYSIKPTDGSGDLAFTRSNDTATRVGPDGLIEKVRTNLSFYSEQFDNGFWNKLGTGLTVTANTTIAPNGTLTADTLNVSNNNNVLYGSRSTALAGNEFTFSIYVKGTGTFGMNVRLNSVTTTTQTKTLTSDWQRFSVSVTNSAPVTSVEFFLDLNTSSTYIVWGAQVESSPVATSYIVTTTDAVSVGPVANVPRLDYLGSSCGKLILEPQRTNNALYSEQFSNAAWSKNQSTISSNSAISPDGYMSADKLIEDSSNAFHDINQLPFSTTSGQTYTFSIFVKPDTRSKIRIGYGALVNFDAFGGDVSAIIDVSNKTVISSVLSPTVLFSDFENGYVRVTFLKQATGSGQFNLIFGLVNNSNAASYLGDGSSGLFIWGAQMEAGAYATSYIPTLGAAVTRGADAASKTGISSLIGSTAGTVYFEGVYDSVNTAFLRFVSLKGAGTTFQNLMIAQDNQDGTFNVKFLDNSASSAVDITWTHGLTNGQSFKIAIAYASNDVVVYQNGASKGTDTSYTPITFSDFYIQYTDLVGKTQTKQALLFKSRLSNSDIAALTA